MPMVLPVSELQRNSAELVNRTMETKEPIYLTRRGYKSVVLIDADEYDRLSAIETARVRHALEIKDGIERGHADIAAGRTVALDDALARLESRWGKL